MITNKFAIKHIRKIVDDDENYTDIFILLGDLNKSLIVSSIQIIENKLKVLGYPKRMITKTKLIGVELLDNMQKHAVEEASIPPYFEISLSHTRLKITSGNCISKSDYLFLNNKLNEYESLSYDGIKDKYLDQLRNGSMSETGDAGLGLLTILKRSEKKYDYKMERIKDNEYYFNSNVILSNFN